MYVIIIGYRPISYERKRKKRNKRDCKLSTVAVYIRLFTMLLTVDSF